MNSAISSEGSMRTSWPELRNGYWANHDGYQYGQMRWNGFDRLPRNVGIRQTLRSEDTCTPLREVKAPTKPTEVMVLY